MQYCSNRPRTRPWIFGLVCLLAASWIAFLPNRGSCQSVSVDFPAVVSFDVTDVDRATTGSPNPFTLRFSGAAIGAGDSLRISVRANAANFTPPSGQSIPASNLSWTIHGAVGGAGSPGTLTAGSYTAVYLSNINPVSGCVSLSWSLAAPGAGIRAGAHTISMTWKVESLGP